MIEDEARETVATFTDRAGIARLERLAMLVKDESKQQNLVAASTVDRIWTRHILDSIQLLRWADGDGLWLDIGTGGGFPGLVIAATDTRPIILAEPRRRRAEFLATVAAELNLPHVEVRATRVETIRVAAQTISARAVAPIDRLLAAGADCSTPKTRWLMPRGAGYEQDMAIARSHWKGMFHVEQSLTDPSAGIVVATDVSAR